MNNRNGAFVDLHLHTLFSDGLFTPEQLVIYAQRLGFSAIAVTDHDSVDGIERAKVQGKKSNLEIVPGVEMSCNVNGTDVHILGYYIDYQDQKVRDFFAHIREFRRKRAEKMVAKLNELGAGRWQVTLKMVEEIAGEGVIGRPHIAQALVEVGAVTNLSEAFEKYIGYDGPAYIPKMRLTPAQAIRFIHQAGGVAVVAHPATYGNDSLVYNVIGAGVDGIEVWHPEHNQRATDLYREMAEKNGLLLTGGSDCHGGRKWNRIYLGDIKVPYRYLATLKRRAKRW